MADSIERLVELNRHAWDKRAEVHFASKFYDVEGFLAGKSSLQEIERTELRDLSGRRLLHLQCHFGLDTLSLARFGARCTGVDLSPVSIQLAKQLSQRTGISAEFVCSDVYSFSPERGKSYDIVYTSYGAICWLPDLRRWADQVASQLAPGGIFYMVEFHPAHELFSGITYFPQPEPLLEHETSYTENANFAPMTMATWTHSISSVVNALIQAGIQIESLNEYPFSPYNCFDNLVEREPNRFYASHQGHDVPMTYSIQGRKPRN